MFSDIPAMAWVVLALGLLWMVLRWWQQKQAAIRAEARELRMAELMAQREKWGQDEAPSSLGAVVSDSKVPAAEPLKEKVCLGCRTVNPAASTTCAGCGLEL
jgi:hypothetical protein